MHSTSSLPLALRLLRWLRLGANHVQVVMMATMFVSFILQIMFRYVFNKPVAWTEEICVITWIWGILWGASFVMSNREDIRFDVLIGQVPREVKRWFTVVVSVSVVVILVGSMPSAWSYVTFMKVESTASLGIRMDHLFSIYIAFVVAMVVRHLYIGIEALRGRLYDDPLTTDGAKDPV
ncbi:TRAP-type C4-dicarboxylate transport system permease small subunit [Hydrogenophaga palleronii]|uniref:TRAP transporter small permease protein n=1 Tax=Hydrogenophaga palleronii TaxID=65655 RepID=A0ABU1WGM1_9BURK|nr:TRAP transporter small permease subunit [Hydrogenophaga palleronii]MDR7148413.1 TRAP-type C4-dicarboxylate transport system permease small subunit [Hydrogenophaga palleronii]